MSCQSNGRHRVDTVFLVASAVQDFLQLLFGQFAYLVSACEKPCASATAASFFMYQASEFMRLYGRIAPSAIVRLALKYQFGINF